jgi:hypothetical protein
MWELICDLSFRWGTLAADASLWHCDGVTSDVAPASDGRGIQILGPASRVSIPQKGPWLNMGGGIRAEFTVNLTSTEGTFLDGGQSFGMYFGLGLLIAHGFGRDVINTYSSPIAVPTGRWTQLVFEHNGFNKMHLFIDGVEVATRPTINTVPGVEATGLSIANSLMPSSNAYLKGQVDTVRVWRLDPTARERNFLARPLTPELADCWAKFIRAVNDALKTNPRCARWLIDEIATLQGEMLQVLAKLSDAEINEFEQMCAEYQTLWRGGLLDSPQMKHLMAKFRNWLLAKGLISVSDPIFAQIMDNACFKALLGELEPMTCDPQATALIEAIAGAHRHRRHHQ